jgi:ribosome-binding protein aMBF1 (putative translation factor)
MTNLEYLRRMAGRTQLDLSKKIGCHPTVISRLERGWQTKLDERVTKKLTRVFQGWTLERLLASRDENSEFQKVSDRDMRLR